MSPAGRALLLALLLLGAGLRIHDYGEPPMWVDEYATSWVVAADSWSEAVARALSRDTHSVFHGLLARLAGETFGNQRAALRLPALLCGLAALLLAYPLTFAVFRDRQAALLGTLVFAIHRDLIQISQDARPYSLALFCAMASFLALLRLRELETTDTASSTGFATRFGYILATVGAYYAHTLFGFIVVIQLAYRTLVDGWSWLRDRRWQVTLAAMATLVAPSLVQLMNLFGRRGELDWIGVTPWQFPFKIFVDFLTPNVFVPAACYLLLAGLLPARASADWRRLAAEASVTPHRPLVLLAVWLLLPLVCFAIIPPLLGTHLAFPRYVLFTLPAALLLSVRLLTLAPRGFHRWAVAGIYFAATLAFHLLPTHAAHGTFASKTQGGWDAAARVIESEAGPEDLVLFACGYIEADLVATTHPGPRFRSYIDWPLLYHLPQERWPQVRSLPFRITDATFPYLRGLLIEAGQHRRVWLAGDATVVDRMSRPFFLPTSQHRLHQEQRFGVTKVLEFRATP
ncbi:MAG: glycosyltransferase family 39 protein [Acidobacteriota bacterium]